MEQKSDEWFEAKRGVVSASMFEAAIGKQKNGKYYAARETYMYDLAIERLTGECKEQISAKSLSHGIKYEPEARSLYELEKGVLVKEEGFIVHPDFDLIGCSPDGLIGTNGGLEAKCPADKKVHLDTLMNGMPAKNKAQVQGALFVTEREYWDFISYCPSFPEELQLYIERIYPDIEYIDNLEIELLKFEDELSKLVDKLRGLINEKRN